MLGASKRRSNLRCFDGSGCQASFVETEIQRFLDQKTYHWFDKVRSKNELRQVISKYVDFNNVCVGCDPGNVLVSFL
jgi:hypothetical protein